MVYRGIVKNGIVILEPGAALPDGTSVEVQAIGDLPTWGEVLKDVIGKAEDLPSDFARNHDHYIHGAPKK